MRSHAAFLEWLTDPAICRPSSHVWLSPSSAGWDLLAGPLQRAGWEVRLSRRRGEYLGLWIQRTGTPLGESAEARGWHGGSAVDLVQVEDGLSAEEECISTLRQLQELDALLSDAWDGAHLDGSIASTAVNLFKRFLEAPIGVSKSIAAELTELDAYGGGHIERYCARGEAFHASAGLAPWEVDLTSAYPTALATVPIPGAFTSYGTESEALDPCTLSVAIVEVPERKYPPLRYRQDGRLYYPCGLLLGTWSALELRAAERVGCKIRRVARCFKFEDRSTEFGRFADALLSFRRAVPERYRPFAKMLGVQFVGSLGSRVKTYRVTSAPETLSGCRLDRPGLYSEPVFEPSERQVLSAALTTTGAVAAWMGLLTHACEQREQPVIYIHTDGGGMLGDPRPSLDLVGQWAASDPRLHWPTGHRLVTEPSSGEAWKVEPLASMQCWAPNRRIAVDQTGRQRIAAGGISRTLTEEEILAEIGDDKPIPWTRAHRREDGAWTHPYHVRDLDPQLAEELEGLVSPQ